MINDLFTLYTSPLCNLVDVRWLTSLAFVCEQTNKTVDSVSVRDKTRALGPTFVPILRLIWSRIDAGIDVIRFRKINRWYDIFKDVDIDIKNFMLVLAFLLDLSIRINWIIIIIFTFCTSSCPFLHFEFLTTSLLDTLEYIDQLIKKI